MSNDFYTHVVQQGNTLHIRGIDDQGNSYFKQEQFKPTMHEPSNEVTNTKTIMGESVVPIKFEKIKDCKEYIERWTGVSNFKVYGNANFTHQWISENNPNTINFDPSKVLVYNLDIEVESSLAFDENGKPVKVKSGGFPKPDESKWPITAIGIRHSINKKYTIFGFGNGKDKYTKLQHEINISKKPQHDLTADDIEYIECQNEEDLLVKFLNFWTGEYPDIYTGWNIDGFDSPYLVNRITKILGKDNANRLSPIGKIYSKTVDNSFGEPTVEYNFLGIAQLDYLKLYKKFTYGEQENYRLDTIANVELGDGKLSYEEAGTLSKLYWTDYQKYIEYNAVDILCVQRLDDKLKFIDLVMTIAYYAKVNYEDVYSPVKTWDAIIYNHLKSQNIVVPPMEKNEKSRKFAGAFVKDPITGKVRWVVSVDLASLYPHLIMQYNCGPETLVPFDRLPHELKVWRKNLFMYDFDVLGDPIIDGPTGRNEWLRKFTHQEIDLSLAKKYNLIFAANGEFFSKERPSFLNTLMDTNYSRRKIEKKKMLRYEQELVWMKDGKLPSEDDVLKNRNLDYLDSKFFYDGKTTGSDLDNLINITINEIARLDGLQMALKILLNSCYGAIGQQYFRYFDLRIAEAITMSGQANIKYIAEQLSDEINRVEGIDKSEYSEKVIAIDTDSNYLDCSGMVDMFSTKYETKYNKPPETNNIVDWLDKTFQKHFEPFIDRTYREFAEYQNAYEHKMFMDREVIAESALWTKKKRYIMKILDSEGVRFAKPKYKVMGQDAIRSSTPEICRDKLKEAYKVILDGDELTMQKFIADFRHEHKSMPIHVIAKNTSANNMVKYSDPKTGYIKGTPAQVKGALMYNKYRNEMFADLEGIEEIQEGEKVKNVYLLEPNILKVSSVSFPRFLDSRLDLDQYIDYKTTFDKTFLKPLTPMLDLLGWKAVKPASLFGLMGG